MRGKWGGNEDVGQEDDFQERASFGKGSSGMGESGRRKMETGAWGKKRARVRPRAAGGRRHLALTPAALTSARGEGHCRSSWRRNDRDRSRR